ncbi:MAG: hypothetical protein AAF621_04450, partial [Pseudomonadota bacterium]
MAYSQPHHDFDYPAKGKLNSYKSWWLRTQPKRLKHSGKETHKNALRLRGRYLPMAYSRSHHDFDYPAKGKLNSYK